MSTIKTPLEYINEPGIIKSIGEYIKDIGTNIFVIGGRTALSITEKDISESFDKYNIKYVIKEFTGYPTQKAILELSAEAGSFDAVVGVGGGKVLDLAKVIGNNINKPIAAIPTIAATCAAWSALSVIYDGKGALTEFINLKYSPRLVLADTDILFAAPVKYLNAGIADTIVKWYEVEPNLKNSGDDFYLRLQLKPAELILEILGKESIRVSNSVRNGTMPIKEFKAVADSVILLAGLCGSIRGKGFFAGIAHTFYNSVTQIPETRDKLHGEKVIFGLIVQYILEGKTDSRIYELLEFLKELDLPVTLRQLGIWTDTEEKVRLVAKSMGENTLFYKGVDYPLTEDIIKQAILKADELGRGYLEERASAVG